MVSTLTVRLLLKVRILDGFEMSRQLLTVPNEILRQKCKPVKQITIDILSLARDLQEFLMVEHNDVLAAGVSAPQLGELVRMFAFRLNPYSTVPSTQVLINPVLVYGKKSHVVYETCFSVPGREFEVQRYEIVKIRGMTLDGDKKSIRVHGLVAQVIQHELNHLDGILIDGLGTKL